MARTRGAALAVAEGQRTPRVSAPDAAEALLRWYEREARVLPWRVRRGRQDPYRVWLSEIMLQQTTVKAVIPYYVAFLARWPDAASLATAPLDDVLAAWAGLGYYSRARNLHNCARIIAREHGGRFPDSEDALRALPGIGPYTAAAIAAIAFERQATPVDGNVERVVARLFAVEQPLPGCKAELKRLARMLTPVMRAGDHAQAMMDLGATVCTPKRPSCARCPLASWCCAREMGIADGLPRRSAKPERPVRRGVAFLALREDGHVLLRKRPESGLLGGMLEVPSSDWREAEVSYQKAAQSAPVRGNWTAVPGVVVHVFTHFRLEMQVYRTVVGVTSKGARDPKKGQWVARRNLDRVALPSVMRKIIAHGLRTK
jgi:A/G-specific adenine glycosylase